MRAELACTSRRALRIGVPLFLLGLLAGTSARAQESADASVAPAIRAVGEGSSRSSALQQSRAPSRRRSRRTPVRTTRAVAPVGPSWTSPRSAPALAADLAGTLQAHTRGGGWGVLVV